MATIEAPLLIIEQEEDAYHYNLVQEGLTLSNRTHDLWAILLRDASTAGHYRYQIFNQDGFLEHHCYKDLNSCFEEAYHSGFKYIDENALDSISKKSRWKCGVCKERTKKIA